MNGHEFEWPVYVAPIADDLLLGSDVLDDKDITVSSNRGLQFRGTWLPCIVTRKPVELNECNLRLTKATVIPAEHEMVIRVPVTRNQEPGDMLMLEPVGEDTRGLMIARVLVGSGIDEVPFRVVNISEKPIKLNKGHLLGKLEPVTVATEVLGPASSELHNVHTDIQKDRSQVVNNEHTNKQKDQSQVVEAGDQEETDTLPEHLRELYSDTVKDISSNSVRTRLKETLLKTPNAFARNKLDLGHCTILKHEIDTACAASVKERVRPTPRGFESEEKNCLDEQIEAGVVRPSSSAWAAPTVLVRKADNSVRWCIDFRKLNDRTVKDAYPLPKITMCLDSLGGARYFSTLDLQSGYWQIAMEESSIHKTAFITKYGLYE